MSQRSKLPYKGLLTNRQRQPPQMFALLLTSAVVATGTFFLYRYLFTSNDEDEFTYSRDNNANNDKNENNETESEDNNGFKMLIFFGSQSGTGEGFAFDMEKEAKQYGFNAKAIDLEDYDPEELNCEQLVIFLVATYGEGEPTDNSQEFYSWLTGGDRMESELDNLEFAVFGLGNSQYEFFNAMGKHFDEHIAKYGGTRLYERGSGDDDVGSIEDQFGEWKDGLWPLLCSRYLGLSDIGNLSKFEASLKYKILENNSENKENTNANETDLYEIACSMKLPYNLNNYISNNKCKHFCVPSRHKPYSNRIGLCKMNRKYELRQNTNDGSSLHIEFDLKNSENDRNKNIKYRSADNLGILVRNDYETVIGLCKRLDVRPSDIIKIQSKDAGQSNENNKPNFTFPEVSSVKNLFLWFLDINGLIGKKLLKTLSEFADDKKEKDELMKLCGLDTDLFISKVNNKYWNLLYVLETFPSINVGLEVIIELLKPLQPRLYTICSSSNVDPNKVSICIKLEKEIIEKMDSKNENDEKQMEMARQFGGVCSSYLSKSKIGDIFQCYIEESKFRLPSHSIPVIMIGVGAGIAPFIAFIDEANRVIESDNDVKREDYGEWWLFFGCRYKCGDYIYKEKMEKAESDDNGCLTKLCVAHSREQKEKIYVQNLIEKNKNDLWKLISEKHGRIYVCGGVAMGKAVRETFTKIFTFYDKSKNGHEYLDNLLKKDLYVQELWG